MKKTGNTSKLALSHELGAHFLDVFSGTSVAPICWGDEPGLTRHDGCAAYVIKQAGLAMVDVTKYTDDRLPNAHVQSDYGNRISIFLSTHERRDGHVKTAKK